MLKVVVLEKCIIAFFLNVSFFLQVVKVFSHQLYFNFLLLLHWTLNNPNTRAPEGFDRGDLRSAELYRLGQDLSVTLLLY